MPSAQTKPSPALLREPYCYSLRRCGRGPNRAVPRRTIVAPAATACSRSPDMPIESSPRPSSPASRGDQIEGRPGRVRVARRRHRHQAVDAAAELPQAGRRRRHLPRRASAPARSAGRVDLHQQRRGRSLVEPAEPSARGKSSARCRSIASPSTTLATACQQSTNGASDRPCCAARRRGSATCAVRPSVAPLREQLVGVVLAEVAEGPPRRRPRPRRGRSPWSRPRSSPAPGSPPARCDPVARAARRPGPATSSTAEPAGSASASRHGLTVTAGPGARVVLARARQENQPGSARRALSDVGRHRDPGASSARCTPARRSSAGAPAGSATPTEGP